LQGSVAGVSISTPYGAPGAGSSILVRGLHSITANNAPLIVVDGVPGGSIDDINPSDIKSIDILKDAASTSIYGSRATNGVIIITTKNGATGKVSVTYEGYVGFATPAKKVDIMNVDSYLAKRREIYRMTNNLSYDQAQELSVETILGAGNELDMYNLGKSYDWQEELFQSAPMHSHSLSLNGGTDKIQYYLSANLIDQKGLIKNSGYQRQSVRANVSGSVNKWFKIGTNLFISRGVQDVVQDAVFSSSFQLSPLAKMYEDETTREKYTLYPMNPDTYIANPFTEIEIKDKRNTTRVMNSTFLEFKFLKDFTYRITANSKLDFYNNEYFTPYYTKQVEAFDKYESASIVRNNNQFLNIENLLSYNKTLGNHALGATFVFATEDYLGEDLRGYGKDFGTDYYKWTQLQNGSPDYNDVSSSEVRTFLESMVGRINYSYKSKYLAQLNVRRDRSSKFTSENREAIFPGASLGWRISEENFMKSVKFLDNLKLRGSYAITGNQDVDFKSIYNTGSTRYYTTGQDASGQIVSGLSASDQKGNKKLKWEKSAQLNAGVDFSVFRGKLSGVVEYYKTWTSDLLLKASISGLQGATSMMTNLGKIENSGIEVSLNANVLNANDFKWDINTSFTTNKTTITELYGNGKDDIANRWFIGEAIGVIYDYEFDGILQEGETAPEYMDNTVGVVGDGKNILPGEAKVKDIGGWETLADGSLARTKVPDGQIDEADMKVIGQTQPDWYGSIGMSVLYKNIDLSFFFNYVHGIKKRIPVRISDRTQSLDMPYYTDENPNSQYGRPSWPSTIDGITRAGNRFGYLSYNQDASYGRLQNITLGYTLKNSFIQKLNISSVRFYATAQNLFTLTKFDGYDPSMEYYDNQTSARVDRLYGYPTTRNWLFGVKVTF
jgi:TonB-linked SusC/RagA family outer membrane protein